MRCVCLRPLTPSTLNSLDIMVVSANDLVTYLLCEKSLARPRPQAFVLNSEGALLTCHLSYSHASERSFSLALCVNLHFCRWNGPQGRENCSSKEPFTLNTAGEMLIKPSQV